jgi:hypothetical protein
MTKHKCIGGYLTGALRVSLLLFVLLLINISQAHAATYYWVASSQAGIGDAANWSLTNPGSCTGGGAGVPTSADRIIFDKDCDIPSLG